MHRLTQLTLSLALICALSVPAVHAQVDIDAGAGVNGSSDGADTSISTDIDASATIGTEDEPVSSEDTSDRNVSVSLTQDDVASASLDASSAESGPAAVFTAEDLSLFATAKMKRDLRIESIDVTNEEVSLEYRRNARFLGIIPTTISATAEVRSDGEIDIDYPWYRFLFAVEGASDIKAELDARVGEVLAGSSGTFSARTEAELIEILYETLSGSATIEGETPTTADLVPGADDSPLIEGEATTSAEVEVYPQ